MKRIIIIGLMMLIILLSGCSESFIESVDCHVIEDDRAECERMMRLFSQGVYNCVDCSETPEYKSYMENISDN